jgi:ribosome-associated toxin RatA of RatAB toxin-antitoxin module
VPDVSLELTIRAPVERVWQAVTAIEAYPGSMDSVRSVRIVEVVSETERRSAWSVTLKGAILEWEELETLDPDAHVLSFHQVAGDMERFDGAWVLEAHDSASTNVRLSVSFEIGIPLLAEMLNPVAQRSLRENCTDMLRGIESDALAA